MREPHVPTRAEDCARWRRERIAAHALTVRSARELATAIEAGNRRYRRLSRRIDDFGRRIEVVRAAQMASPAHRALVSHT
jgi:hypothetical protein